MPTLSVMKVEKTDVFIKINLKIHSKMEIWLDGHDKFQKRIIPGECLTVHPYIYKPLKKSKMENENKE